MNPNIHTCRIITYYLLIRRTVFQKRDLGDIVY